VEARQPAALDLLERTVNVNSGSFNLTGVREVGALFDTALREVGLSTEWVDGAAFDRAGHLVARHGERGPHLLLIGHLDTVFEPDRPFQRFERIDGNLARGPGVTDMKGGNVVIVEALHALQAIGALNDLQITVVLIGDEESSGRPLSTARAALIDAAHSADVALGFEDGDGNPATAVIARRGYTGWQLDVTATPAHSSLIFREETGYGAAFEVARILDGFRLEMAEEENLTLNPGLMLAGTTVDYDAASAQGDSFGKDNVIPGSAVVSGDLRTLSAEQERTARARMRSIVGRNLTGAMASIEFTEG
jgi:glutamate carboxypeptidase